MLPYLRDCSGAAYRRVHHVERWLWRDRVPALGIVVAIAIVVAIFTGKCPAVGGFSLIIPLFSWIAARSKEAADRQAQADERAKEIGSISGGGSAIAPSTTWYQPYVEKGLAKGQKTLTDLFGDGKK
jgi:hypothetical protein